MQTTLDRLEARIDYQATRIDALYELLRERGLLPLPGDAGRSDGVFEEPLEIAEAPLVREARATTWHSRSRLHVGTATGV